MRSEWDMFDIAAEEINYTLQRSKCILINRKLMYNKASFIFLTGSNIFHAVQQRNTKL